MPALVLIDIQQGLDEALYYGGNRNNPEAERHSSELLEFFRNKKWPVFHVQHHSTNPESPLYPGKKGHDLKPEVKPIKGETLIKKSTNSAFVKTDLENILRERQLSHLVFAGLTTDHCVSASVRTASDLGFSCVVVSDATATFDKKGMDGTTHEAELVHRITLASLSGEFATVMDASTLLNKLEKGGGNAFEKDQL